MALPITQTVTVAGGWVVGVALLVVVGGLLVDALLVDGGLLVAVVDVVPPATVRDATGWVVEAAVVTGDAEAVEREATADVVGDDVGCALDDGVLKIGADDDDVSPPEVFGDDDAAVALVDPALDP